MKYPAFYNMYKDAIKNKWTIEDINWSADFANLCNSANQASIKTLVTRLAAFLMFCDSIISKNLSTNIYRHVHSPEARMLLSRQLFEESLHTQLYLTVVDHYIPNHEEQSKFFKELETIPSIQQISQFCFKWMNSINTLSKMNSIENRRQFLMNLICFSTCIEGLFFSGANVFINYFKAKNLFAGFTSGMNHVFRDKKIHINFTLEIVNIARNEEPGLFNNQMNEMVIQMMEDAIDAQMSFAKDLLNEGLIDLPLHDVRQYLEFEADQHLKRLKIPARYKIKNPFQTIKPYDCPEAL